MSAADTLEKKASGELWEACSKVRFIFRLDGHSEIEQQIRRAVA